MAVAAAPYYFQCRVWWCRSHPNVKIYPQTKFRRGILIHGWDITTSGLENQRPPNWNSSLCDFDQTAVICVLFWFKYPNFVQIGPPAAEWWRHLKFQDGGLLPVLYLMSLHYSELVQNLSANQISSKYLNPRLRYNYFRFGKQPFAILKLYFRF